MSDKIKKKEIAPTKIDLNSYSEVTITLSFNFPPTFNLDVLKEECKNENIPISVDTESNIKGTVFIDCKYFDLKNNLNEIRAQLKEPIKKAIQKTKFPEEIKREVSKTQYFKSVIKFLQQKYGEYHANKVTKEQVIAETQLKYGHLLGEDGSKIVADLYDKQKKNVVSNYFKLQEYLIKHYSIEFFLYQQIQKNYFLIIMFHDNDTLSNANQFCIPERKLEVYEKKQISPPGLSKLNNMYIPKKDKNSIIIVNPIKDNYKFINKMLELKNINGAILFMNHLFNKQKDGLKEDLDDLKVNAERLKSSILRKDSKSIDKTLDKIEILEEISFNLQEEFILKIKKFCDEMDFDKTKIQKDILSKTFDQTIKHGGQVTAVQTYNPPSWLFPYLFADEFIDFRDSVYYIYDQYTELLTKLRKLKEYIVEYKHTVEMREFEKMNKISQLIITGVNGLVDIIRKIKG